MKNKLIVLSGLGLAFAPLAFAQNQASNQCQGITGIEALLCKIGGILNTLIPILIVLGVVYFIWGVITYMIGNDEEAKKAGRNRVIFGIIGLVVIVGMWGLVNIVTTTFGLNGNNSSTINQIPCVAGTPGC